MNQETLLRICMCYLNTNYLRTEDLCNIFNYEYDDITEAFGSEFDHIGEIFEKNCAPIKDEWLDRIQSDENLDDDDLQELAMKLVMKLNHLCRKIDRGA